MLTRRAVIVGIATLVLLSAGVPTAISGGWVGLARYPRYFPEIIRLRVQMLRADSEEVRCARSADPCYLPVGLAEFRQEFIGNAFNLVRPQSEQVIFESRATITFSPPQAAYDYYYIGDKLCFSPGENIFPHLKCNQIFKAQNAYYLCERSESGSNSCTKLHRVGKAEAL